MAKIIINHSEVTRFMLDSKVVEDVLKTAAGEIKNEMQNAMIESKVLWDASKKKGKWDPPREQKVFEEKGDNTDRQRYLVGIENAHYSDFTYNSVGRAVAKAGGRGKRGGR